MLKNNNYRSDQFKLYYWNDAELVGKYRLPQLVPTQFIPEKVISFHERPRIKHPEQYWVDFFIDDYKFENFWRHPEVSFDNLRRFSGIITPDYSMLPDMLPGQIIWNNTRNRVIAYYLQINGFNIIPTASWCGTEDFDWCFDGLPEGSSIAVSTNGCMRSPYSRRVFMQGIDELYRRKHPTHLIVCGSKIDGMDKYTGVVYYPNFSQRWRQRTNNGK